MKVVDGNTNVVMDILEKEFIMDQMQLELMRELFQNEIEKTNRNELNSLKNEGFSLQLSSLKERGVAVSLDFGGTDIRAYLIELNGEGSFRFIKKTRASLRSKDQGHDFVSDLANAEELFDFQAEILTELIKSYSLSNLPLGYVFSYPMQQLAIDKAILTRWAKEINTPGVEGQDVVSLLKQALKRNFLNEKIDPKVVLNDTVGTFMASVYLDADTVIGSVIGTGYNSAFIERDWLGTGESRIVNLECGNFDKIKGNRFDVLLDKQSSYPGQHKFEKMVSGYYLGELFRLALVELISVDQAHLQSKNSVLFQPYAIDTSELSIIIADQSKDLTLIKKWGSERLSIGFDSNKCRLIKRLAEVIARRSAYLIAMSYTAILNYLDLNCSGHQVIAINGSLYEKLPGYKEWLNEALFGFFKLDPNNVSLKYFKEGPALGAAVAACLAKGGNLGGN